MFEALTESFPMALGLALSPAPILAIIIPILIYFFLPNKMELIFHRWKDWLIKNNTIIVITMLLIFGILLIYIGFKIYLI